MSLSLDWFGLFVIYLISFPNLIIRLTYYTYDMIFIYETKQVIYMINKQAIKLLYESYTNQASYDNIIILLSIIIYYNNIIISYTNQAIKFIYDHIRKYSEFYY